MKLPKGYLSPSQVQRYMSCPACYFLEYIEQRERPVGVALPIGGAVHRGIEFARRRLLAKRAWELDEVIAVGVDHFDQDRNEEVDLGKFPDRGAVKDEVARLLEWATPPLLELDAQRKLAAVEVWVVSDPALLNEAERRHQHLPHEMVAEAFPCPVKGRLDAIYGGIDRRTVADLKTASRRGVPQGAGFQLAFYLMPFLYHGRQTAGYIDVLVKSTEPTLQTFALGKVELQTMRDTITDVAECIDAGYFPPRPSMYCNFDHGFPSMTVAVDGYKEAA